MARIGKELKNFTGKRGLAVAQFHPPGNQPPTSDVQRSPQVDLLLFSDLLICDTRRSQYKRNLLCWFTQIEETSRSEEEVMTLNWVSGEAFSLCMPPMESS